MPRVSRSSLVLALLLLAAAAPAGAQSLTFVFSGTVSAVMDVAGDTPAGVGVAVGDSFSGTISYEPSAPATLSIEGQAVYDELGTAGRLLVTVNGTTFGSRPGGVAAQVVSEESDYGFSGFNMETTGAIELPATWTTAEPGDGQLTVALADYAEPKARSIALPALQSLLESNRLTVDFDNGVTIGETPLPYLRIEGQITGVALAPPATVTQ